MGHPGPSLVVMLSKQPQLHRELYTTIPLGVRSSRSSFKDLANGQTPDCAIQLVDNCLDLITRIGEIERYTLGHFRISMWRVDN